MALILSQLMERYHHPPPHHHHHSSPSTSSPSVSAKELRGWKRLWHLQWWQWWGWCCRRWFIQLWTFKNKNGDDEDDRRTMIYPTTMMMIMQAMIYPTFTPASTSSVASSAFDTSHAPELPTGQTACWRLIFTRLATYFHSARNLFHSALDWIIFTWLKTYVSSPQNLFSLGSTLTGSSI